VRQKWKNAVAGQCVQIIKPDDTRTGVLEFGTELVASEDPPQVDMAMPMSTDVASAL
jgi:L-2-hydroxyglutarate oxidase LhgO